MLNQPKQPADKAEGVMSNTCGSRQSGKAVLKDVIFRMHQKANELQVICDMLPEVPTPEQDVAIWNMACNFR